MSMPRARYNTASRHDPHGLTHNERLYADMLLVGRTTDEMAAATGASVNCVRTHLSRAYRKLGVDCAAYAIDALRGREDDRAAHELDVLTLPEPHQRL